MRRLFWLALLLLLSTSTLGCAWLRAAEARQLMLDHELTRYVIEKPLEEAWKIALSEDKTFWEVIAGRGLNWEETGRFQARSATETETDKETDGAVRINKVWFDAEGVTAGDGSQIHFFRNSETHVIRNGQSSIVDSSRYRDLEMELAFIKKLDPKAGAAIEAKARSAEEDARNE
jgi:hypothetical protein